MMDVPRDSSVCGAMNAVDIPPRDLLGRREFAVLAQLIHDTCGINLPASKKSMLEGRLRKRVRALGLGSLGAYVAYLFEDNRLDGELDHLIDVVTTNKTDFFREPEHFRFLAEIALPDLVRSGRPLVGWSAASSIGAEAYTMAMVMAEYGREHRGFQFNILGTDICSEVLKTAELAIYPEAMIDPVPMPLRRRYIRRSADPKHLTVRIAPDLRRHVHFTRLNLIDGPFAFDLSADVIFCRNVLIYFDKRDKEAALANLCRHLAPGGFLFVGHSETVVGFDLPLRHVAATVFRKE